MKLKDLFNVVKEGVKKNDSAICAAVGIAGLVSAVIFAFRAAPKCKQILETMEGESNLEKAKEIAPVVAPVAVAAGVGIAADLVLLKKNTKLTEAVSAGTAVAGTLTNIIKETEKQERKLLGDEKADEIQEEVKKAVGGKPTSISDGEVYDTGKGKFIFYEPLSGAKIRASKSYIRSQLKNINLWIKDQRNKNLIGALMDTNSKVAIRLFDIVNELYPGCCDSELSKSYGWLLSGLYNNELSFDIGDTFEYTHPDSDAQEPGYIIKIVTPGVILPGDAECTYEITRR